jgi:lysozyme
MIHPPDSLKALLIRHEGLRLLPYHCSAGKLTIGVGRNLEDRGITNSEAMVLLETDIEVSQADLRYVFPDQYMRWSPVRRAALTDMMLNLGRSRFLTFAKFRAAVAQGQWDTASREMLDSRWATQVGQRAIRLADMIRTSEWPTK